MLGLDGLRILVIGANGFLGRHLIRRLVKSDVEIHAISRNVAAGDDHVRWWHGDATQYEWVSRLVKSLKPNVIYQLSSASQGGQDARWVLPCFEDDLRTTVNTLLSARQLAGTHVVLAASSEEPVYDGSPIKVSSPYAAAKAAGTFYGIMFHQLYGLPVSILRPFMTYGPGQKPHKVIPYTILSLLKHQPPRLSSGTRPVDWVYVEDVIQAFVVAAAAPDAIGKIIDLGSGTLVPIRHVVECICELIPDSVRPQIGAMPDRMQETIRQAETATALRVLGWKATTPLREGLIKSIQWYRESLVTYRTTAIV